MDTECQAVEVENCRLREGIEAMRGVSGSLPLGKDCTIGEQPSKGWLKWNACWVGFSNSHWAEESARRTLDSKPVVVS